MLDSTVIEEGYKVLERLSSRYDQRRVSMKNVAETVEKLYILFIGF